MKTEEELRARLSEIREEAKNAKSDAVLTALKFERDEIVKQIGQKCQGCGQYFLSLKFGFCISCYTAGPY